MYFITVICSGMNEMTFDLSLMAVALSFVDSHFLVNIDFGELPSIFTGLFQVAVPIAIVLFVIGIFALFFPGIRRFVKGLGG